MEINRIVIREFWYDCVKPKYGEKGEVCYMDTDSVIANIKTKDIYVDIAMDLETRSDTSNYKSDSPLPTEKYKKLLD